MKLAPKHPVARFQRMFTRITADTVLDLAELYHDDVHFVDPFHEYTQRQDLEHYFRRLTKRMAWAEFSFDPVIVESKAAALPWTIHWQTKRYPKRMSVEGVTHLRFDDRITYHRDYFDVSAAVADALPGGTRIFRLLKGWV